MGNFTAAILIAIGIYITSEHWLVSFMPTRVNGLRLRSLY
jgi:hypothetical protein